APGCGAGRVEGPSQAPRPAGVSGPYRRRSRAHPAGVPGAYPAGVSALHDRAGTLADVPSMNELVRQHTALDDTDLEWLHLLVSEWQLLSDLSFADLVLWVPTRDGTRYVSVAQMRPNTGPTSYQDD